jgi:catechol 2,3-dioxygenase-like lactoylglutathione lyase family enzyme
MVKDRSAQVASTEHDSHRIAVHPVEVARWHDRGMPLNHVALTVRDRERSAAFYGEHFGLTERLHADDHLFILGDAAGSVLALSAGAPPAGIPRTNHFGFQLADGGEVRAARERFRAAGVEETEWQDDGRFVRVQVADPDGYRVELYSF